MYTLLSLQRYTTDARSSVLELHIVEGLLHEGLEHSLVIVDNVEGGGRSGGWARTAHGAAVDTHRLARRVAQLGVKLWYRFHRGKVHFLDTTAVDIKTISDQIFLRYVIYYLHYYQFQSGANSPSR